MDRIVLAELTHTIERVWTSGTSGSRDYSVIRIGRLDGHRWWVDRAGHRWAGCWAGCWAVADERAACDRVIRLMGQRPGEWVETPPPPRAR